jgi:hypothetical protein
MNDRPSPDGNDQDRELLEGDDPGLNIAVLQRRREYVLIIVAAFLIVVVSIFAALRLLRTPEPTSVELASLARTAVRERFPGGHVLQFSDLGEMSILKISDAVYEVKGRVVAIARDGKRPYPYVFTCSLQLTQWDGWQPSEVSLTQLY